jgi:carbonic anhydrase/acetyltransferase-like protein (isoleucine patch superfamily)
MKWRSERIAAQPIQSFPWQSGIVVRAGAFILSLTTELDSISAFVFCENMQASDREEQFFSGLKNRFLQALTRHVPGARTWRVWLNRLRGVRIGENVWIGYDAIIETSRPDLVTIRDRATVQIRATIIAHFREKLGVVIEEDATVGPGAIILPNVTIGHGAIVTAGSVVTKSVPPKTMVQGNPARPIATVEVPLGLDVSVKEFAKGLRSVGPASSTGSTAEKAT